MMRGLLESGNIKTVLLSETTVRSNGGRTQFAMHHKSSLTSFFDLQVSSKISEDIFGML